jgi:hypothetical protein
MSGGSIMIDAERPSDCAIPAAEVVVLPYLDWAQHAAKELRQLGYMVLLHRAGASGWIIHISGPPDLMLRLRRTAIEEDSERKACGFEWAPWINGLNSQQ